MEIIKFAKKHDMDLIAIGTQGRSATTDALVGSAARTVVRQAKCRVLMMHPYDRFLVEESLRVLRSSLWLCLLHDPTS